MAELLKGAAVAAAITESLNQRTESLKSKGAQPCLAVLRVGENDGDLAYERGLLKRCEKVGIEVKQIVLPEDAKEGEILSEIRKVNEDNKIHGCLMFRPLKDKTAELKACDMLLPKKDVDAMTPSSMAGVFLGNSLGYAPCTAQSCIEILKYYNIELTGANVVVIGRSAVIGKPVSMLLQKENATVTMCHTKTKNLSEITRAADIIIAAAGKAKMLTKDYVKPGQVIIDVGINTDEKGNMCGDADFEGVEPIVKAITPVPGGVGAVTTSILAAHLIDSAEKTL